MKDVCYEIEIMKKFRHPYLCYLFTVMETKTSISLVMEYCAGGELFNKISYSRGGKLKEEEAKFYAIELICVLSFLHENLVCYRDLKPDNVMIDYDLDQATKPRGSTQQEVLENSCPRRSSRWTLTRRALRTMVMRRLMMH